MSLDESLRQRFQEAMEANRRLAGPAAGDDKPLEFGGGGGDSGGMDGIAARVTRVEGRLDLVEDRLGRIETRMDRLETRMDGIDTRLRGVEQTLSAVSGKLDLLTSQVVAKLPSWWQMPAVIGSTIAVLAALWAGARFLMARGLL